MGKLLGIAFTIATAFAADDAAAIRSTFVEPYVAALRTHDPAKVAAFLHPLVRACRTAQNKEYFDYVLGNEMRVEATGKYIVTRVAPLEGPVPLFGLPPDGFPMPVQPTYDVQIQFGDTVLALFLAPAGSSWYNVYPCANEKGVAFMHDTIVRGEQQRQNARKLAAELKNPLLAELQGLLKQGQIIDAIKRYQSATGADLTTAKMVTDALRESH